MSIAPRISKNSDGIYDLKMTDGKIETASDGTQVAQHVLQRLMTFRGENSLNDELTGHSNTGTRWYEVIFNMQKSQTEKEFELKRQIINTPGVLKILEWNWTQDIRTVTITGTVQTLWGSEAISEVIEPL